MANQQSWHDDERKITFIVCARGGSADNGPPAAALSGADTVPAAAAAMAVPLQAHACSGCASGTPPADLTRNMAGDVNAFLSEIISDPQDDEGEGQPTGELSAELEVMIADASHRRRGLAEEALLLLIHFLLERMPAVSEFVAKVSDGNEPSLRLFTDRLGFHTRRRLDVFEQTELVMDVTEARRRAAAAWRETDALEMEAPMARNPVNYEN